MTIALVQQPDAAYGSGATVSNTFASQPTEGNLLFFTVICAANQTITSDDGLTEIGTGYETFRRVSYFAKIAAAAEQSTFDFTLSASASRWCYATEYSTTDTWDAVSGAQFSITFDSSGSNDSVTTTIGSTTSGSLLVAAGYMADSTTDNQQITTGFSNFEQPAATGAARRSAQADKTGGGGSQSATFGRVDTNTDNRLASALAEFTVTIGGPSITPTDATPEDGTLQTITGAGMTGPVTAATYGGLDILADLSGTDPTVAITFTTDVSATEASTGMPRIGEDADIIFTTGTDGAISTTVVTQPKTNWAVVTLAGTLEKDPSDFLTLADSTLSITTAVGNLVYYNNARGEVITATGGYTGGTTVPYQGTEFVIQQGGSATVAATSVGGEFFPFGQGGGSGLTFKRLTSRKLTATKLIASKL